MKTKTNAIFLLTHTPFNLLATYAFAHESISQIVQHIKFNEKPFPKYTILIHREEDIHAFVRQVPELAWEMMEYAEEPLELLYPQKKYIPPFEDDTFISVRLVRQEKLIQVVRKFGPLISFPVEQDASYADSLLINEEINCSDKKNQYTSVKTMKLYEDGSFTFLR